MGKVSLDLLAKLDEDKCSGVCKVDGYNAVCEEDGCKGRCLLFPVVYFCQVVFGRLLGFAKGTLLPGCNRILKRANRRVPTLWFSVLEL